MVYFPVSQSRLFGITTCFQIYIFHADRTLWRRASGNDTEKIDRAVYFATLKDRFQDHPGFTGEIREQGLLFADGGASFQRPECGDASLGGLLFVQSQLLQSGHRGLPVFT